MSNVNSDPIRRYYKCKLCGSSVVEGRAKWKKKRQTDKNICPKCLEKRKLAKETAEERGYPIDPYGNINLFRTVWSSSRDV